MPSSNEEIAAARRRLDDRYSPRPGEGLGAAAEARGLLEAQVIGLIARSGIISLDALSRDELEQLKVLLEKVRHA